MHVHVQVECSKRYLFFNHSSLCYVSDVRKGQVIVDNCSAELAEQIDYISHRYRHYVLKDFGKFQIYVNRM